MERVDGVKTSKTPLGCCSRATTRGARSPWRGRLRGHAAGRLKIATRRGANRPRLVAPSSPSSRPLAFRPRVVFVRSRRRLSADRPRRRRRANCPRLVAAWLAREVAAARIIRGAERPRIVAATPPRGSSATRRGAARPRRRRSTDRPQRGSSATHGGDAAGSSATRGGDAAARIVRDSWWRRRQLELGLGLPRQAGATDGLGPRRGPGEPEPEGKARPLPCRRVRPRAVSPDEPLSNPTRAARRTRIAPCRSPR